MTRTISCLAASVLLLAAAPAFAAPAEIAGTIHAASPYGQAKASALFMTAYKAALWTDAPSWSMDAPFALSITYAMSFDTDDLVSRTIKEMKHVDPSFGDAEVAKATPQLNKAFPPVKSGDTITALYVPGKPVRFWRDGKRTGRLDAAYAKDFFGIWLSPQTSDSGMRSDLLKLK
jgi:hypothetical protein